MHVGANVKITTNVGAVYAGVVITNNAAHVRIESPLGKFIIPWLIVRKLEVL